MMSEDLNAAYLATTYWVIPPSGVGIPLQIGQLHPDLDHLVSEKGHDRWAFITACNPQSVSLSDQANAIRLASLRQELERRALLAWSGAGVGRGSTWPAEPSFLVLGVTCAEARDLARSFGQNAFVCGREDGPAALIWTVNPQRLTARTLRPKPRYSPTMPQKMSLRG